MTKVKDKPKWSATDIRPFQGNPSDISPWVEKVAALVQRLNMTDEAIAKKIGQARGHRMAPKTVTNFRELKTHKPHDDTIDWLLWAAGYVREIRPL